MALTNAGRDFIAAAIMNDGPPTFFDAADAHLGVGDSSTAYDAAQTDLQAASNKLRKAMEAGYPSRIANVIQFQSLFGTGDANFAWNEWGVFNASSSGTMLSRKAESLGTKANTQSWLFTVSITVSVGA